MTTLNIQIDNPIAEKFVNRFDDKSKLSDLVSKFFEQEAKKINSQEDEAIEIQEPSKWDNFTKKIQSESLLRGQSATVVEASKNFRENFQF